MLRQFALLLLLTFMWDVADSHCSIYCTLFLYSRLMANFFLCKMLYFNCPSFSFFLSVCLPLSLSHLASLASAVTWSFTQITHISLHHVSCFSFLCSLNSFTLTFPFTWFSVPSPRDAEYLFVSLLIPPPPWSSSLSSLALASCPLLMSSC